ncbi:MAG: Flp family type IVb pilin [Anaerovoracaceae bacterium]|jgi:pilus assembly protein Flp/PilA
MRKFLNWFKNEESGQGMVEYGLIVAVIAGIVIVAMKAFGDEIKGFMEGLDLNSTDTDVMSD